MDLDGGLGGVFDVDVDNVRAVHLRNTKKRNISNRKYRKNCTQFFFLSDVLHVLHKRMTTPRLTSTLAVAVGQRQRVSGVDLSLAVTTRCLLVLLVSILHWHLAEFAREVGRTLTLVSGTALPPIYTRKVTDHWEENSRATILLS